MVHSLVGEKAFHICRFLSSNQTNLMDTFNPLLMWNSRFQIFKFLNYLIMGRIPDGRQFNTFDENSFEGNVGLCGFPLPKKCNEYTHKPQLESHEGHEEESGFTWEVLTLGYIWMWDSTWIKVKWFNAIQ
ncbi:hypothetical protein CTI12_AA603890 [Artemisia annua]|uniref:Uncharacterized protein n=1 Tax=Artemisia annua TaxID=35608 RepID=A0A2U1KHE3_ARTAN|nr:hypothetical protein CTI12_AA603890 [Artemisia annua]